MLATWRGRLIVAVVLAQLLIPLTYYSHRDPHDERFAWRMFSPMRMLGSDFELSDGIWTCGKDGQSVPVGVGTPTVRLSSITVGGTQA